MSSRPLVYPECRGAGSNRSSMDRESEPAARRAKAATNVPPWWSDTRAGRTVPSVLHSIKDSPRTSPSPPHLLLPLLLRPPTPLPSRRSAHNYGDFANLVRVPFTKPHRLYVGPFVQSFPSQAAAIEAAHKLSAGKAPAHMVTSFPATLGSTDEYLETSRFNVYQVDDVQGPMIENPVVGWKPWNTVTRLYHDGEPWGVLDINARHVVRDDYQDFRTDLVVVDGKTIEIDPRKD